jgi:NAD(P)-dependent dehydrogenase (short-subunit alcohol dehydrogenase family)
VSGRLEGRVAIVTGGGSGIGASTAVRLAREGARVVVADINSESADRIAQRITAEGHQGFAQTTDVTDSAQVRALIDTVVGRYGRLDVVVNVAGGFTRIRSIEETDEETWSQGLALNLTSVFLVCKAALPHLKRSQHGRIVNISSQAARAQAHFTAPEYVAAKGGMIPLTWYLAKELGPFGATANVVCPGPTWSDRTRRAWGEQLAASIAESTVLGHIAESDELADAIAFLCSDDARYITGATLDVNGGFSML